MKFRLALGYSDFRTIRRESRAYVDKTAIVGRVIEGDAQVVVLPRPRRFGKTLNLSMLRYFFEACDEDRSDLFEGLTVWSDEAARRHFQRHPVIFLTFKDVKGRSWADCVIGLRAAIFDVALNVSALTSSNPPGRHFNAIVEDPSSPPEALSGALKLLSQSLAEATGEQVLILIDEYDSPIHAGFLHGYYDEVVGFFRSFLSGGLKDNPHLFRGVVTGILRLAKESIFSGLNNLAVYDLLSTEFATDFGFTEPEVRELATRRSAGEHLGVMRRWYDGYDFDGTPIYNPWSVVSFLSSADRVPRPHWISTSANELVRDLLVRRNLATLEELETLLEGGSLRRTIQRHTHLRDLHRDPDVLWNMLLYSGYLTADDVSLSERVEANLRVPNLEVRNALREMFRDTLRAGAGGTAGLEALTRAMLEGDVESFGGYLGDVLRDTLSTFDLGGRLPERVYHAFVAGLLVHLAPDYRVRSNRESGYGRLDAIVTPSRPGQPGAVLELKVLRDGTTPQHATDDALRQIVERAYAAELHAVGADPVWAYGVVFDGKRAHVALAE